MKGISLFLVITLLLLALSSCGVGRGNDMPTTTIGDEYVIDGKPLVPVAENVTKFNFNAGLPGFSFVFSIPSAQYSHITNLCTELEITATVGTGDKTYVAEVVEIGNSSGMWKFEVPVDGIFRADYLTGYTATLYLSFKDPDGKTRTLNTKSIVFTLFDAAYYEYCDRSARETDKYKYHTGNDYSPYFDLSHHYAVLCSSLFFNVEAGEIKNVHENRIYQSPYDVKYFDGVITVKMKNGTPINPDLLNAIIVNNRPIYYEIHDGIIRVVWEGE